MEVSEKNCGIIFQKSRTKYITYMEKEREKDIDGWQILNSNRRTKMQVNVYL